ncbi:MAG: DUF3656 domain-containing protein, partial [Emergencia timonensis]
QLTLHSALTDKEITVKEGTFEESRDRAMDSGRIEKALRKTGNTPFEARTIRLEEGIDRIIQISAINDMRRRALEQMEQALVLRRSGGNFSAYFISEESHGNTLEFYFYDWESFCNYVMPDDLNALDVDKVALIPLVDYEKHYAEIPREKMVLPYITNISKGEEDQFIEAHFDAICEHYRDRGIYIGNLSWLQAFLAAGVPVYGDYGLNICNAFSRGLYCSLGLRHCMDSLEILDDGLGAFPLMITEHELQGSRLIDRKKERIKIVRRDFSSQVTLIPESENLKIKKIKDKISEGKMIIRIYC